MKIPHIRCFTISLLFELELNNIWYNDLFSLQAFVTQPPDEQTLVPLFHTHSFRIGDVRNLTLQSLPQTVRLVNGLYFDD